MDFVESTYMIIHNDIIGQIEALLDSIAQISTLSKGGKGADLFKIQILDIQTAIMNNLNEFNKKKTKQKINIDFIIQKINFCKLVMDDMLPTISIFVRNLLKEANKKKAAADAKKLTDEKAAADAKKLTDEKAAAEKAADDANADLLKELYIEEKNDINKIIKKNPYNPGKGKSDQDYINFIKSELKKIKKKLTPFLTTELKEYIKEQNNKRKEAVKIPADEVIPADELLVTTEVVSADVYEVSEEVTVKKEQETLSIDKEIIRNNIHPYLELFTDYTAEPSSHPDYRNGILAITCFTKKNRTTPNDYVEDIGLHGLWPYPINPTNDEKKTDINYEDEIIKEVYKERNPYILQNKSWSKSKSKKAKKFYTYTYEEERTNCLAEEYDYFDHEWVKHGKYASIYEKVDDYLKEACELAKPIILILKAITTRYAKISFETIITMMRQIPFINEYFLGGFIFNKDTLPYGKELHFRIVGIRDSDDKFKFKWKFGQHYIGMIHDSGKRRFSRNRKNQQKSKKSKKKKSTSIKQLLRRRSRRKNKKISVI